ncbi:MAG: OmpA family protein [Bacteroidales bacterium]|nr:OmpA family protein [Bacteroidales bacterium]
MKLHVYIFIFFTIINFISIFAQEEYFSKNTKKADLAFASKEYYKALTLYETLLKKSENKYEKAYIQFKIAECYRLMNQTAKAEAAYRRAIQRGYYDPISYFYLAEMLKANEKYSEAIDQYKEYLQYKPADTLAQRALKICTSINQWIENPTRYVIENFKEINSKESDFGCNYANDDYTTIYFTSTREGLHGTKINPVTGSLFSDIFEINFLRSGKWDKPTPLNDTVNSEYDDGTPTFSADYNEMFFTRCKIIRGIKLGCQIYRATRAPGEDWSTCEQITTFGDSVSAGHPSLSPDGTTLYFAANAPGGFGGYDIYFMKRPNKNSKFSAPQNLNMPINTPGDELYPFIRDNGVLYFASNGHIGMGGLDIFKALKDADGEWIVENMRYPINSSSDDFGIVFKKGVEEGLFCSSRPGGKGKDDIYKFVLPPIEFVVQGVIKDAITDKPISNANVKIVGSDGTDLDISTGENGTFKYKLNPFTKYIILAKKDGYLVQKIKISTQELSDSKIFSETFYLSPITEPVEIENIYYDFAKWELRPEAKKELNKLIDILNANPNITIELGSHTDMVGDSLSNIILSQRRAQSVVDYLISKGIDKERIVAKGYGKNRPKTITPRMATYLPFKENTVLTPEFINSLQDEKLKELANQLNRRTEFKVLSTNYIPDIPE